MFSFFSSNKSVSVQEAFKKINSEKTLLIDVREPDEYKQGHAKNALNMPLSTLDTEKAKKLTAKQEVLVICQSGGRSARAVSFLTNSGVNAINVEGGTMSWKINNLPME